jgi:hypothetical protein
MENSSQEINSTSDTTTEVDVSTPFPVFPPSGPETQFPSITFGSIGIPVSVPPFTYVPRPQSTLHIPTIVTITSTPQLASVQQSNNSVATQSHGASVPAIPNSMILAVPSFTYSGSTTPYQLVFPTANYVNPVFPAPYMLMVSPEVWGAGQQGLVVNLSQLAHMNRLEELRTRLTFTESATTTPVSTNQGVIPLVPAVVATNNMTMKREEQNDELSKPYRLDAFIAKSKFTSRIAQAIFPKKVRMPSTVSKYDGTSDPDDHLNAFIAAGGVEGWTLPVWCHMFWKTKDKNEILHIRRKDGESVEDYIT